MTREEMHDLFKAMGGVTYINALIITMVKFATLGSHWNPDRKSYPIDDDHYPDGGNCGLCYFHNESKHDCSYCLLKDCDKPASLYRKLGKAIQDRKYDNFEKYCLQMIGKLQAEHKHMLKVKEWRTR